MKFPRTKHMPISPGRSSDDKTHEDLTYFLDKEIVLTEKLDGENQCWWSEGFHLRSESSDGGALRARAKAKHASIRHGMADNYYYFVEDISNEHSIQYQRMDEMFFLIAVYDMYIGYFLSWKETVKEANLIGLPTVPLLYQGMFDMSVILKETTSHSVLVGEREGIVVREADLIDDWTNQTAKWVRANHVTTDEHWQRNAMRKLNE